MIRVIPTKSHDHVKRKAELDSIKRNPMCFNFFGVIKIGVAHNVTPLQCL